jgi:cytochrome c oxidase subunit 2
MYGEVSNFSSGVNTAFLFILGISILFLIGLTITMVYFVFKYNRKKYPEATVTIEGSTKLELLWTIIPTILVLAMFYFGWTGYNPMRNSPADAMVIKTTARMWNWNFEYPNGKQSDTLYVPRGKAVRMNMASVDVLHSLYIPAFSVKEDIVPGKDNFLWFEAKRPGEYDLFCTEYCGLQHSGMITRVKVIEPEEFALWLEKKEEYNTTEPIGLQIIKKQGCIACHSIDGSRVVGPSFKGAWGRTETVETDGAKREITVDAAYVKKSIYEPNADVVDTYAKGLMQSYQTAISDKDIEEIVAYFQTLK